MAITITDSPERFTPAFSPMPFVVTSTNNGQTNFKYVADIYISGVVSPAYVRIEKSAHPTSGHGFFDISSVIRQYVLSDFSITSVDFTNNPNSFVAYEVKFGEQYGASGSITTYPMLTVTGTKYAWNGVVDYLPFTNYNENLYLIAASTTVNLLTSGTISQYVGTGSRRWLHMMTNTANVLDALCIKTYNSSGTLIGEYFIPNSYTGLLANSYRFVKCGVGPYNLDNSSDITIISGTLPAITVSVAYYDVYACDASYNQLSQKYRYYITSECSRYDTYSVHWRNKLGGFDGFDFTRRNNRTTEIERSMFKRIYGAYTTGTWTYSAASYGASDYNIKEQDSITLISKYLTDSEAFWLQRDLLESGEIYIQDSTYGAIRCRIANAGYTIHNSANGELFQLVLDLRYSHNRYSNI